MGYITEIRKKVGHDPIFMPCASGVIIENDKMLLQKRSDDGTWAFHGGGLEFGETFEDALKREFKEELGINVLEYIMVAPYSGKELFNIYPNGDQVYPVGVFYLVTKYNGEIKPDMDEVSEVKWFSIDKLPDNFFHCDRVMIEKVLELYRNL